MHQKIKKQLTSASLSPEPSAPMHPGCRLLSFVARSGRNSRGEARMWQRRSLPGVYHAYRGPSPVPPFLLSQAYPWSTPSSVQNHTSQVRGRERVTTLELRFLASSSWPRNFSARLGKKKIKQKTNKTKTDVWCQVCVSPQTIFALWSHSNPQNGEGNRFEV